MCGSGRFLVPILERGYNIDGFDSSIEMLERCKNKIKSCGNDQIIEQNNFSEYKPSKQYDFIFIPSCSYSLITVDSEIKASLSHLKNLLAPNGKIVLELFTNEVLDEEKKNRSNIPKKRSVKEGNIEIILYETRTDIKEENNVANYYFTYELYKDNIFLEQENETIGIKYYYPNEFDAYLKQAGLDTINKYINYNRTIYSGQKTDILIYELQKS